MHDNQHLLDKEIKVSHMHMGPMIASLDLTNHPMEKEKLKIRFKYYSALNFIVTQLSEDKIYTDIRLRQYRNLLVGSNSEIPVPDNLTRVMKRWIFGSWDRRYSYFLLCDLALILREEKSIVEAQRMMEKNLSHNQSEALHRLCEVLINGNSVPTMFSGAIDLIAQFRQNRDFSMKSEKRYIVTANMSAGKSTLINALIGKALAKTSQEACTSNLSFIYNKPYEDHSLHLSSPLNLNASKDDIHRQKSNVSCISSYFRSIRPTTERLCLIDTPGVNSFIHTDHKKLTVKAIKDENYDRLLYIFNASMLGTNDEISYLKFITDNVPINKIIFVINKLDIYNHHEDSIESSIKCVRKDLSSLGFSKVVICPLTAYYAFLLKLKHHGDYLNDDQEDEYKYYTKKFLTPEYDLSNFYEPIDEELTTSDDLTRLAIKSGFYGFEKILYGVN